MSHILLFRLLDSMVPQLNTMLAQKGHRVIVSCPEERPKSPDNADIVLIDASGGQDGSDACRRFKQAAPDRPLVLLSAPEVAPGVSCRLITLNYVLQFPFTTQDVLNEIDRALALWPTLQVGDLALNTRTRNLRRQGRVHRLTPKQASLLQVFMCYPERTLTRRFLMETIWNTNYMGDTRTLDVHVRWLRERIETDPSTPKYLRTVRGVGYRFGIPPQNLVAP